MRNNPLGGVDPDGHCCWDNIKNFLSGMKDVAVGMWDDAFHRSPQGTVTITQTFSLSSGTVAALSTAVVQQGLQQTNDDSMNQALDAAQSDECGAAGPMSGDTTFTNFTNAEGFQGITGVDPYTLTPGQTTTANQLNFGVGDNPFNASQPGDIVVTDLPATLSFLSLSQIGVFGDKQSFGISFSGTDAASQGVLVRGEPGNNIFTLPANSTLTGCLTITCR
jgi:hypothetical protein